MSAPDLDRAASSLREAGLDAAEARSLAEVAGADPARLAELVQQRIAGTPLAYLTGRQCFMGIDLLTAPGALIPRPETELLARAAIELLRPAVRAGGAGGVRFLDLCCGSGNLACAIAVHVPEARGVACDLTPEAVQLARKNVEHLGLAGRVEVLQGDLFAPLAGRGLEGGLDALVCNPPYISTGRLARDRAPLLAHEPREAFDGGPYGLAIHQRVAREAPAFLRPGAPLMIELGEGQDRQVVLLLKRAGSWQEPEVLRDPAGVARAVMARRKEG